MSALGIILFAFAGLSFGYLIATLPDRRESRWDESLCRCGHDRYRHVLETDEGACDVIGCPCQHYR